MRRRRFLASTALLGATGLAGCTQSQVSRPQTPSAPASVADWDFETSEPEGSVDAQSPPRVRCRPEANTIQIAGTTEAGNSCDWLLPKTIAVDGDTFQFSVGVYEDERPSGCGDVLQIRAYEATFEFSDGLPERVVAVESGLETRRTENGCGK